MRNRAKTGKKQANETKPWQNRAKQKDSPNFGLGSVGTAFSLYCTEGIVCSVYCTVGTVFSGTVQ